MLFMDEFRFALLHYSGKTRTIAAGVLRYIQAGLKVLCVAETNAAARNMCQAIAKLMPPDKNEKLVPSDKMQLIVSQEFEQDWHERDYDQLRGGGYMKVGFKRDRKQKKAEISEIANCDVIVCTMVSSLG